MVSDFSKGVMISLNEHMAQTLLTGMTSAIRKDKLDLDMQIKGLEMLVESLESLNTKVVDFMDELRRNKENVFFYEDLDLEGIDEWEPMPDDCADSGNSIPRLPSPITYNPVPTRKFSSQTLSPLQEDNEETRESFLSPPKVKLSVSIASPQLLAIEMPHTPPLSSIEPNSAEESKTASMSFVEPKTLAILKTSEFRPIDPKKIPTRKPVPSQLQIPSPKSNKAFKRKEVPKRMYENPTAATSTSTFNLATRSMDTMTPPSTDEELSPVTEKQNMDSMTSNNNTYQPKPRRVKSKQLKIAIPHRKSSAGKALKTPLRTPSSASIGSARLQKRAMEELDRAVAAMNLGQESPFASPHSGGSSSSNSKPSRPTRPAFKRADSGRERRVTNVKRKMSLGKRRKYTSGVPRCDSPVLGEYGMLFPVSSNMF